MKKSLIALAVAGALTAPMIAQADATLYGVAQYRGIFQDDSSFKNNMAKTRLGVKGTVDNDIEGLTTGFQFEWEFKGDNASSTDSAMNMRKSNVYLKGGFGNVVFGSQNNPLNATEGYAVLGKSGDAYALVPDRVQNTAAYITPMFGGAEVYVALVADGAADTATESDKDIDLTVVGFNWSGAGFGVSAGIMDESSNTSDSDESLASVGVKFTGVENLYLAATYTAVDNDDKSTDEEMYGVGATYAMGKVKLMANYEAATDKTEAEADQDQSKIGLGVSYALGAKAAVAVEYFDFDSDAERIANKKDQLVLQYTLAF
ncbi:MAG: porin [Motiliproteus sp.]